MGKVAAVIDVAVITTVGGGGGMATSVPRADDDDGGESSWLTENRTLQVRRSSSYTLLSTLPVRLVADRSSGNLIPKYCCYSAFSVGLLFLSLLSAILRPLSLSHYHRRRPGSGGGGGGGDSTSK